jgi:hypothetical protein
MRNSLEPGRNILVGFPEKLNKVTDDVPVTTVEEGSGVTRVSGTAGTTDTMDVVVNVRREIVIDDVRDVGNIKTTCCDSSGYQDGGAACTEGL